MKEAEIPLDFSFVFELAELPSLEEELQLEKEIRSLKASEDIESIKKYAEETARQNYHQSIFIASCLTRIAKLQTRLVEEQRLTVQKKPTLLQKILKLQ